MTDNNDENSTGRGVHAVDRRRFIAATGGLGITALAGCNGEGEDDDAGVTAEIPSLTEFRGSGTLASGRPAPGGTSIEDLPDLSGDLNLYIGGGEGGIYYQFVEMLQEIYPDFTVLTSDAGSASLAQTVVDEVDAGAAEADVFWSIDASSLGYVADNDAYEPLSDEAVGPVPSAFRGGDNAWVGVAGRARSVPYNTDELSESDIPDTVADFPEVDAFQDSMAWAPSYGAFQAFVTTMRLQRGPDETRQWLESMVDAGIVQRGNEYVIAQQVADGALSAGFGNHYYAMRVLNQRPDAPIDLAFTQGDAGALVNVAGALAVKGTEKADLVADFVRHLLSAEAQEFFATVSFAYPMIPGVQPVGGLPTIDELSPPDIDLAELAELEPTLELMREAGVL
ncbi:extracellular solute-binding protein [Halorubrum sp. BOL3-1]|uniref:extracellular solute-binding protein n=1 Tax=Halorubrum sp. BOL3-1 TaxID=2497325 RepID=UPI001004F762|nr:extracellular solute-binding protein [Halorubrum sp. BOL3-1]QAU13128.1 extracellular solute-binding protein [Halorubrum sp. BOL3-1]